MHRIQLMNNKPSICARPKTEVFPVETGIVSCIGSRIGSCDEPANNDDV
jgi:hypothetical protein